MIQNRYNHNDTERYKEMRKARHPFLSFFIKLEKDRDCFDILKEKKKQILGHETSI